MSRRTTDLFDCIRTQGGLLPADFLARIADPAEAKNITGLAPADYHLTGSQKITEAINRSWNSLQGCWQDLKSKVATLPEGDAATGITRDLWLLPLFQELGYGRLQSAPKLEIEERHYPISHLWGSTPIHLLGVGLDLDRTTKGAAGAARMSPHSMMQEFLNRAPGHLWAILANGYKLRLLRDNKTLTRQAFVEFDLYAMFEGEAYSDFVLLWLLCHQSRVESERPESCILEKWTNESRQNGVRLLDGLRTGVEHAIEHLGAGFLAHPNNHALKDRLRKGELSTQDYYRQILRQVYRFLFLFVAEDRELLLRPDASESAKNHFRKFYSTRRLRQLAERHGGTRHGDLWELLKLVTKALGSNEGCPALGLPALGSYLWRANESTPDLINASLDNRHLLDAIRALATVRSEEEKVRRIVDYRNLGPEELGSVYESLLELHPEIHAESAVFKLNSSAGSDRKTTGSYYTPDSLVQCLLDSALEPVVKERLDAAKTREEKEKAILSLKVCDKACGSGHFLIAAAHRLARTLAAIRSGEDEPSPLLYQHALRDVISRCIYGVDLNPMAVELCKITLWLEAIEPGKPLSFLDHHIQCGNSLLGATPALMAKGIPDAAFEPIEGDDKKYCSNFKKENKQEAKNINGQSQGALFDREERPWEQLGNLATGIAQLSSQSDDSLADVQAKEHKYAELVRSTGYEFGRQLADAWCAAFVWKKCPTAAGGFDYPITNDVFRKLERNPHDAPKWLRDEIKRLAGQYQFFHWHLAFPDVFQVPPAGEKPENQLCGWNGGFDVSLGNPPWEKVQLEEKQFFETRNPEIAKATSGERRKILANLPATQPLLWKEWIAALRRCEGEVGLLKRTGRYPLSSGGNINTYALFLELASRLRSLHGRCGVIVPSGIATDESKSPFFQELMETSSLVSLYDLENAEGIFPNVHSSFRFALVTIGSASKTANQSSEFAFFARQVSQIFAPNRRFTLTSDDIKLLNPNSRTCPTFRSTKDTEIVKDIYRRVSVVEDTTAQQKAWNIESKRMIEIHDSADFIETSALRDFDGIVPDTGLYGAADAAVYVRLFEGKMVTLFDHRHASVKYNPSVTFRTTESAPTSLLQHVSPNFTVTPQFWIKEEFLRSCIPSFHRHRWFIAYKRITSATNERTMIASVIPFSGLNDSLPIIFFTRPEECPLDLLANINAFAFDYVARTKVGGLQMSHFIFKQLPVVKPTEYASTWLPVGAPLKDFVRPRVLELTYTAWDLEAFAQDCGWGGPPFRWDEERRFLLRCELDAAFFHLYGLSREDTAYIMDTFPIVRRKDEARTEQTNAAGEVTKPGRYITKDTILEIYDALAESTKTGQPYQTRLNPPPADPACCHPARK